MYKNDIRLKLVIELKNRDRRFGELKYNQENFQNFTKHSHQSFNIVAIETGVINIEYHKQKPLQLQPRQIALFNPNEVHLTSSQTNKKITYYSLHLDQDWSIDIQNKIFNNSKFLNLSPSIITNSTFADEFLEIAHTIINNQIDEIEKRVIQFANRLFSGYCQQLPNEVSDKTLVKIEHYILQNLQEPLTIEKIAKEVGYSSAHINRLFRNEYGLTLHAFLIDKRIEKAKQLIAKDNTATLTQIAQESGFFDQSHFIRNFKRVYSLSPKSYKNKKN